MFLPIRFGGVCVYLIVEWWILPPRLPCLNLKPFVCFWLISSFYSCCHIGLETPLGVVSTNKILYVLLLTNHKRAVILCKNVVLVSALFRQRRWWRLLDPLGENNIVEDVEIQEMWESWFIIWYSVIKHQNVHLSYIPPLYNNNNKYIGNIMI